MNIFSPPDKLTFSLMQLNDIDEVHKIEVCSFEKPWQKESFVREIMDNCYAFYLIARDRKKIVAYGGIWLMKTEAHITTLAVRSDYRQRGIAGKLINAFIQLARKKGAKKMSLEVRPSNQAARKLYEKQGFFIKGVKKKYYMGEDAYIMWRRI